MLLSRSRRPGDAAGPALGEQLALQFCTSPGELHLCAGLGSLLVSIHFAERLWAWFAGPGRSGGASPRPSAFINTKALAGSHCQDHHQVLGMCINRACRLCPSSHGICTHRSPPRSKRAWNPLCPVIPSKPRLGSAVGFPLDVWFYQAGIAV